MIYRTNSPGFGNFIDRCRTGNYGEDEYRDDYSNYRDLDWDRDETYYDYGDEV